MSSEKLTVFSLGKQTLPVRYVETQSVKEGVECDIYVFTEDSSRDLAIVRVAKGYNTPLQRVLMGDITTEGCVDGVGSLTVRSTDGLTVEHSFKQTDELNSKEVTVKVGQMMQWHADGDTDLTFYEICQPPYVDGRFENLDETV